MTKITTLLSFLLLNACYSSEDTPSTNQHNLNSETRNEPAFAEINGRRVATLQGTTWVHPSGRGMGTLREDVFITATGFEMPLPVLEDEFGDFSGPVTLDPRKQTVRLYDGNIYVGEKLSGSYHSDISEQNRRSLLLSLVTFPEGSLTTVFIFVSATIDKNTNEQVEARVTGSAHIDGRLTSSYVEEDIYSQPPSCGITDKCDLSPVTGHWDNETVTINDEPFLTEPIFKETADGRANIRLGYKNTIGAVLINGEKIKPHPFNRLCIGAIEVDNISIIISSEIQENERWDAPAARAALLAALWQAKDITCPPLPPPPPPPPVKP